MIRTLLWSLVLCLPLQAGLHLSLEALNELPANWKGYLPDHRRLRTLAAPALDPSRITSLFHSSYADALLKLESKKDLSADEVADLGALYVRLGNAEKAIGVLRAARARHPEHFALAANLGTAWQVAGDLEQARTNLAEGVRLAPAKWKDFEAAHLKLVELRLKDPKRDYDSVDPLFDTATPSTLATAQCLALWLPHDGRLLWQLGALADKLGDTRAAANILEGCVSDSGLKSPTLRADRQRLKEIVAGWDAAGQHAKTSPIAFKSLRAFDRKFDEKQLPKVDTNGVNVLPWAALAESTITKPFELKPLSYVKNLDARKVNLVGYMRPLTAGKSGQVQEFLLTEYAIGCWFCESPDPLGMLMVELKEPVEATRGPVRVEGLFELNLNNPEAYFYRIKDAKLTVAD